MLKETMPVQNPSASEVQTVRNRQFWVDPDGVQYTRKVGDDIWTKVEHEPVPEPEAKAIYLYVVQERQAEGEPRHWSLLVASEEGPGMAYQVTGDATFMAYKHETNVDKRASPDFAQAYQVAELDASGAAVVQQAVNEEAPPQAENRASVKENCQGWVVRVLRRLQGAGVVTKETVDGVDSMVEEI